MNRSLSVLALVALLLTGATGLAQPPGEFAAALGPRTSADFGQVSVEIRPKEAKPGQTVSVLLTVTPAPKAWTYPNHPSDPKQDSKNAIRFPKPGDLIFVEAVTDPPGPKTKPREGGGYDEYYPFSVTWTMTAVVSPKATPGPKTVPLKGTIIQICNDASCFPTPPNQPPTGQVTILDGPAVEVDPKYAAAVEAILHPGTSRAGPMVPTALAPTPTPPTVPPAPTSADHGRKIAKPTAEYEAELTTLRDSMTAAQGGVADDIVKGTGLGAFLATAALWGLISLVTPCVFPMIPITVSIFLKQAHGSLGERLKLAGVYCLTIISVLGVSAFALLKFMAWLSAHPVTNLALAGLFLVLALSLFGMYELTLPNFMVRRLQAKQAKGGVIGTVFGALAFTVISFTCVAPFLGGFAGISAADTGGSLISIPTAREVFGGLAFATAFAAPFFVLALVPGLMKALPRSGGWLDSVKVVMGFLELAAALKFLRTAELRLLPTPAYFTYDVVLAGWVSICVACGLYLLNVYRLPHDEERPNIGVPRLLFAALFLGLGVYLFPAMFKTADGKAQRPAGAAYAWVEAFLLPESDKDWGTDLKGALDRSRVSGKPVFLDFTGVTCTNCKYNEQAVFTRPEVKNLLQEFEGVQLYTDEVPVSSYTIDPGGDQREKEAIANRQFQGEAFKDTALPLYAVLMPLGEGRVKVVGVYNEGKINSRDKFAQYLRDMLEKAKK